MNEDDKELVRRLMSKATVLIETAHDAAVAGQSGEIAAEDYAETARRLQATARDVVVLAEAVLAIARVSPENGHLSGQKRPR